MIVMNVRLVKSDREVFFFNGLFTFQGAVEP